jgi:DNA invertase Pin-like site-specific DNA recombinase
LASGEFERELVRVRTSEGRARAKARGVKLGRAPKLTPHQKRRRLSDATRATPCGRSRAKGSMQKAAGI